MENLGYEWKIDFRSSVPLVNSFLVLNYFSFFKILLNVEKFKKGWSNINEKSGRANAYDQG